MASSWSALSTEFACLYENMGHQSLHLFDALCLDFKELWHICTSKDIGSFELLRTNLNCVSGKISSNFKSSLVITITENSYKRNVYNIHGELNGNKN